MPRFTVNNLLGGDTRKISSGASPFDLERMKRLLETIRESTIGKPVDESFYQGIPGQEEYGGVPSIRGPRWHDPEYLAQQGMFLMQPVAYHGTPHTFERFSTEKIGTGEGAQAYGHGLYFAENPEVASEYAKNLGFKEFIPTDKEAGTIWDSLKKLNPELEYDMQTYLQVYNGDLKKTATNIRHFASQVIDEKSKYYMNTAADLLESGRIKAKTNLYKVNIKPPAEKFLDWDKPLSEQGKAGKNLISYFQKEYKLEGINRSLGLRLKDPGEMTGKEAYYLMDAMGKGEAGKSSTMSSLGVPGIKYLDQASRGRSSLDVLKKNLKIEESALKDWESARVKNMYPEDFYKEKVGSIKKSIEHYKKVIKETEKIPPTYNYVVFSDKDVEIIK